MLSLWGLSLPDPHHFISHSPNCKAEPVTTQVSSGPGMAGQEEAGLARGRLCWAQNDWVAICLKSLVFISYLILS